MIKSMTGFGKRQVDFPDKTVTIEIRCLNSKQMDINTRVSSLYREKDLELRNLATKKLERGKTDISLYMEYTGASANYTISEETALDYYKGLKKLEEQIPGNKTDDYLGILAKLPEVVRTDREDLDEEEWKTILATFSEALDDVDKYRIEEGKALYDDMVARVRKIMALLPEAEKYEEGRIQGIRERISRQLEALENNQVDHDRFEQEMIYYLEKLDVTEEKIRLKKHCEYFLQVLDDESAQGKKLGFITQEIGREINTLGSKASEANIQQIVVGMKDELEKIKEQLMNIL
jgi:uncharacterized protein (TIGR00255 family)